MDLNELSNNQAAELYTSTLSDWQKAPQVLTCGAIILCRKGRATMNVNFKDWTLYEGAVITLFPTM